MCSSDQREREGEGEGLCYSTSSSFSFSCLFAVNTVLMEIVIFYQTSSSSNTFKSQRPAFCLATSTQCNTVLHSMNTIYTVLRTMTELIVLGVLCCYTKLAVGMYLRSERNAFASSVITWQNEHGVCILGSSFEVVPG